MYACMRCGGTGDIFDPDALATVDCPRCFGSGELVEDSQGLQVAWGGVDLGLLTRVQVGSATVSLEDVTGLNSPTVNYGTHTGMIRQLIAGDITPGKVSVSWIGAGDLTDAMVGKENPITFTHPHDAIKGTLRAILTGFDTNLQANGLVEGTASFQLLEV